ncbi:DUF4879 domain-containing protein, partial [Xanthomonas citri]
IHRAITVFPPVLYQQGAMDRASFGTTMLPQGVPDMHILAPAPPLSRVIVYAVGSTQFGGWEYMTTVSQASTTGNHGGTQLRVVVQEVGYGGGGTAWMNSAVLPSSANYFTDPFCQTGSYYTACSAGQTVVGFYHYYNLDGYQSGLFKYQNYSLNAGPTLSMQINIL